MDFSRARMNAVHSIIKPPHIPDIILSNNFQLLSIIGEVKYVSSTIQNLEAPPEKTDGASYISMGDLFTTIGAEGNEVFFHFVVA